MEYTPDVERFLAFANLEETDVVPLAELGIDHEIMKASLMKDVLALEDVVEFYGKVSGLDFIRVLADGRGFDTGSRPKEHKYSLYSEEKTRSWAAEGEGVIKDLDDLEEFTFPDLDDIDSTTTRSIKKVLVKKHPKMGLVAGLGDVFTRTWQLLGFTKFCMALRRDRRLVRRLYERIAKISTQECKVLIEAGVDALWPSDDIAFISGPMIKPEDLREFFFPWLAEIGHLGRKHGLPVIYHSDGDLRKVMKDIIDCNVDVLHPIEPKALDINELKERWGDKLAFIGNIDLEYTLTLGSPQAVVSLVKRRIRDIAPGGGYAVGSSNTVPGYVKLENYLTMIRATKKFGKYPIRILE